VLLARNAGKPRRSLHHEADDRAYRAEASQLLDEASRSLGRPQAGGGSRLAVGTRLTRGELLLALMSSENRAAHALGATTPAACRRRPGHEPQGGRAGMRHTRFVDPTGLSAATASRRPGGPERRQALATISGIRPTSQTVRRPAGAEFHNTNTLVRDPSWDIVAKDRLLPRRPLSGAQGPVEGRTLVMVLLDSYGKYSRFADARRVRKRLEAQAAANVAPPMQATGLQAPAVPAVVAVAGS
jgi:D-alanyl-D-alanine endopeptidase (penicillin-binding protein 7)